MLCSIQLIVRVPLTGQSIFAVKTVTPKYTNNQKKFSLGKVPIKFREAFHTVVPKIEQVSNVANGCKLKECVIQ